ncbi:dihydrofolate reductase [Nocardia sp. ET3-3]|uniref:Dihydrofolate reductase n=1 Tax=Nocardia terrae TaxID=2675851 RepID=A0A7K1V7X5_9NOCA|nr:dihydrofolate reductase family protein [Nocardia terrae]MVU82208.1 dihydrofolate reductase [Nocardia terrae]
MRKITAGMFISLDGIVADPQDWHFPYYNEEMGEAVSALAATADTMLFGRVTYEGFAGAWPERENSGEADAGFAKALGDMRKVVFSHRELDLTWRNSEQLPGDLVEAAAMLKAEVGGDITLSGSTSIVRQLLAAELLDELHLFVHPVVLRNGGLRLFDEGNPIPLQMLSVTPFKTGVLHVVYGPAAAPAAAGYEEAREHLA